MQLEVSRKAQSDLDAIQEFSVARFGRARAISYIDAIERACRRLLEFPSIGILDSRVDATARSISCHEHRIFYEVVEDRLVILRILHKAMDASRQFTRRG